MPDPSYSGRLTTAAAVVEAENLLTAFDDQDPRFAGAFLRADRDVLGAVLAFASLGVREVAARDGVDRSGIRQVFGRHVSHMQTVLEKEGV